MSGTGGRLAHYLLRSPRKLASTARTGLATRTPLAAFAERADHTAALPPLITLQMTWRCNLRCVQCGEWGEQGAYKQAPTPGKSRELSTEQWRAFLAQAARWRPYLYLFGGEPLLRMDLPTLIEDASRLGMPTALNSNTTLVTAEVAERLMDAGLDHYIASLDGPQPVNDAIRKGRDVYDRVMAGLGNLLAARARRRSRVPTIEVCFTVTEANQHHIAETAALLAELPIDRFSVQLGIFTTPQILEQTRERVKALGIRPDFWAGYVRDTSAIRADVITRQLEDIRARGYRFALGRYPHWRLPGLDLDAYFHAPERPFGGRRCRVVAQRAYIAPDGTLVACPMFPEYGLGNVTEAPFETLWNSARMRAFRAELADRGLFPACARCCDFYELDRS